MYEGPDTSYKVGLMNWISAISAIMVRDIKTRFAGGSLGHAWSIIIPVSWIFAITLFFKWLGRDAPIAISLPLFLATGMLPYLIFRQIITSMMRTVKSNRHLITLGPVRPEDLFTATTVLEFFNALVVCGVVIGIIALFGGIQPPSNPPLAFLGLALAVCFGAALGRLTAILAHISDSAMRLVPILLRPFFWLSGIFFVAAELPQLARDWLWYNPLLHIIEILRTGFFDGFTSDIANPIVPVVAVIVCYFSSRVLERHLDLNSGRGIIPA